MGLLSAMNKSVGGLNAQSFALENISGNIANSQTTAFKRTDTSFEDLVQSGTSRVSLMSSGNVRATARATQGIQGAIEGSSVETYMGVKGSGYFVVKQKAGEVDGQTVFGTGTAYTRRGDYSLDKEGYLVNGAGYYLAGLNIDAATGNPIGDTPDVMQINKSPIAAEQTSTITYKLNLPETPFTTNYTDIDAADRTPANALFVAADFGDSSAITADEDEDFQASTISGGAVTAYDENGTPVNVQLRWAKIANGDGTNPDEWQLYYKSNSTAEDATTMWSQFGGSSQTFEFDSSGAMTTPATTTLTSAVTIDGSTLGGTAGLTLDFGSSGLTQAADTTGQATIQQLTQDGSPVGNFVDVSITDGGRVVATYSNGQTKDLYQVPLVSFAGESSLRPLDGGAYAETKDSGPAVNNAQGAIVGASLEASNVDISEEFTKLIVTQQAFSANSKVISTADQMMSDVLNIIR